MVDDASRLVICGGEFDNATTQNSIALMKKAIKIAYEKYSAIIMEVNTDKGCQFYANKSDNKGNRGRCEFELFLEKNRINHIPSRRNHPQTNGKNERSFHWRSKIFIKYENGLECMKKTEGSLNHLLNGTMTEYILD